LLTNASGKFILETGSPAIDAGGALTHVSTADPGLGFDLIVDDAGMFQDGWAGTSPDWIAVGTVGNVAQITSINLITNTLTLATPLARSAGQPVFLFKDSSGRQVFYGAAPDIGAYEYGSDGGPTNPSTSVPSSINFDTFQTVFNPKSDSTLIIRFVTLTPSHVSLIICVRKGSTVRTILDEDRPGQSTPQDAFWDGRNTQGSWVASGMYILILKANGTRQTKKLVVIK